MRECDTYKQVGKKSFIAGCVLLGVAIFADALPGIFSGLSIFMPLLPMYVLLAAIAFFAGAAICYWFYNTHFNNAVDQLKNCCNFNAFSFDNDFENNLKTILKNSVDIKNVCKIFSYIATSSMLTKHIAQILASESIKKIIQDSIIAIFLLSKYIKITVRQLEILNYITAHEMLSYNPGVILAIIHSNIAYNPSEESPPPTFQTYKEKINALDQDNLSGFNMANNTLKIKHNITLGFQANMELLYFISKNKYFTLQEFFDEINLEEYVKSKIEHSINPVEIQEKKTLVQHFEPILIPLLSNKFFK